MIRTTLIICYFLIYACCGLSLQAQQANDPYDTVKLERNDRNYGQYTMKGNRINTIRILFGQAVMLNDVHFSLGSDIKRDVFTLFTGIGVVSANEVNWLLPGGVSANDSLYSWHAEIYCPGAMDKVSHREKNGEGSFSTAESTYEKKYYWEKGAVLFIIDSGDTIGNYQILTEPRTNPKLENWSKEFYKGEIDANKNIFLAKHEFACYGELFGKASAILYNVNENQIYLFEGSSLKGIYHVDKLQQFVRKSKRVHPFLLIKQTVMENERNEVLMLALVGQLLKGMIDAYR